jgi:hypothetical protein
MSMMSLPRLDAGTVRAGIEAALGASFAHGQDADPVPAA